MKLPEIGKDYSKVARGGQIAMAEMVKKTTAAGEARNSMSLSVLELRVVHKKFCALLFKK